VGDPELGAHPGLGTSAWLIRLLVFCGGSAVAYNVVAVQAASFATISPGDTGRASALFQTQSQVAAVPGISDPAA
jgi:hypothetical protein